MNKQYLWPSWLFVSAAVACGTPPPAAQPAAEPAGAPAPSAPTAPAAASSAAIAEPTPEPEKAPSPAPPPAPPKPSKSPKEILTAPDVAFLLSFAKSEAGEKAEKTCEAEAAGDPSKMAPCRRKAEADLHTHAIRFVQDAQKNWWWQVFRRRGGQHLVLHKVRFEFGEETDSSIIIKPQGKDQGMAPWGLVPKEVTIEIVDEFTIALDDKRDGRLVFEARIGAMK